MRLYLASTSPARLATLRAAGIEPAGLINPEVDEDAVAAARETELGRPLSASEMVLLLAQAKAEAVTGHLVDGEPIDGFIVGGDSAFELGGHTHGKPHTPEVARARWANMVGATGTLHSGHWVIDHRGGIAGTGCGGVDTAQVTFSDTITDDEVDAYIATREPLAVAGAFTLDSRGAAYISRIDGNPSTVIGISIPLLRTLIQEHFGTPWHTLWNR